MDVAQIYIMIAIVILAVIALVFFVKRGRKVRPLSPLTSIAFAFVISGIVFGENRFFSYGLMGIGIFLAIVDAVVERKK